MFHVHSRSTTTPSSSRGYPIPITPSRAQPSPPWAQPTQPTTPGNPTTRPRSSVTSRAPPTHPHLHLGCRPIPSPPYCELEQRRQRRRRCRCSVVPTPPSPICTTGASRPHLNRDPRSRPTSASPLPSPVWYPHLGTVSHPREGNQGGGRGRGVGMRRGRKGEQGELAK